MSLTDRQPCEQCKSAFAPSPWRSEKQNKQRSLEFEKKCKKCQPQLLSANALALDVYSHVQGQLLLGGMGEAISLRFEAVEKFISMCHYKNKLELSTKVLGLSEAIIQFQNEKRKTDELGKQGPK